MSINNMQRWTNCIFFLTEQDNNQNRIGQWMNVSSGGLILQFSHELNAEAPLGHYQITADTGNKIIRHQFKVEKYGKWHY